MRRILPALALAAATPVAHPVAAQVADARAPAASTIAITGGTVAIGDGSAPIPNGTVVIRAGRVIAAGAGIAVPAGATVIDARGKWVAAGIVAAFTDLGLVDADQVGESNDSAARTSPFSAAIDVADAINARSHAIGNERTGGVTRAFVVPRTGASIFAGQGAVIDLGDDAAPVTRPRAFQFVALGEAGARVAGGSRPAAYAMLRDAFERSRVVQPMQIGGLDGNRADLVKLSDARALRRVIDGETPLLVQVDRAADILQVLSLRREYPKLRLVLAGAAEGWMVAREIAAARVPVIAAALADLPFSFEALGATESNVGLLARAGATVAISTLSANTAPGEHVLAQYAGNLVAIARVPGKTGLDWGAAFATITSRPAEVLGMEGEIGSLRAGRRADVVIWDGDPLEVTSAPVAVWIDGVAQPMASRQRRLRDRYLNPVEGALPKAYEPGAPRPTD